MNPSKKPTPLRRWTIRAACAAALAGLAIAGYAWWSCPHPSPPTEIFRGVTYSCEEIRETECNGLVFVVQVDLAAPGIGLYLTPLDSEAAKHGYQYRLAEVESAARREDLAVAVNGTFFSAASGLWYKTGDLANGDQTIIADGVVSHDDPNSYMLWFEPDLTPHIEAVKPPADAVLRHARWGIGGGAVALWKGRVQLEATSHEMDRRTAVGIDSRRRLLWLAVLENASSRGTARVLAEHGAQDGFLLDGGHSTAMVLGMKAAHVRSGVLFGGSRPVANCFGIRAQSL
jgi:hypothetical protein